MLPAANRITELDLNILRAFQFKHAFFLLQSDAKALPFVFPQMDIPSVDRICTRLLNLSGLNTVMYDCCPNSCCCFVGNFKDDRSCSFCGEQRFRADGRTPQKCYSYSPIIPRLRAMYENKELCKQLLYRHEYQVPPSQNLGPQNQNNATVMADIWALSGFHIPVSSDLKSRSCYG